MIQTKNDFVAISFQFNDQSYTVFGAAIDAIPYVAGNTEELNELKQKVNEHDTDIKLLKKLVVSR